MDNNDSELLQAEQLDRVISNIVDENRDLFDSLDGASLSAETMDLIDLAVFVLPEESRGHARCDECVRLTERAMALVESWGHGESPKGAARGSFWTRTAGSIAELGTAIARFGAALVLEPAPQCCRPYRIDSRERPWYNLLTGAYAVSHAASDAS